MKKLIYSAVAMLCIPLFAQADKIPADRAMNIVTTFINKDAKALGFRSLPSAQQKPVLASQTDGHYVFNIGKQNGFVVVAADDKVGELILGYSENGTFDSSNIPDNMKWWLGEYDRQIEYAVKNNLPTVSSASVSGNARYKNIEPLLASRWGQNDPYNTYCPEVNGKLCPTGCVATALSQVMRHNKWPDRGVGTKDGTDFSTIAFNWDAMTDTYSSSSSEESKEAVARLMRTVGIAAEMKYELDGSGTSNAAAKNALVDHMKYSGATLISRRMMSGTAWLQLIHDNLSRNHPMYYDGVTDSNEGHAFVCDGYKDGYIHINWGWDGMSDGYFVIDALDPAVQGTGGSIGGFNLYQSVIVDILNPNLPGEKYLRPSSYVAMKVQNATYTRSENLQFTGTLSCVTNESKFCLGVRVCNTSTGEVSYIKAADTYTNDNSSMALKGLTISLSELPSADGTYSLEPVAYGFDSNWWYPVLNMFTTNTAYKAVVAGDNVTVSSGAAITLSAEAPVAPEKTYAGEKNTFKAVVGCNDATTYRGRIYLGFRSGDNLIVKESDTNINIYGSFPCETDITVLAPDAVGEYAVAVYSDVMGKNRISDETPVSIVMRDATLTVSKQLKVDNVGGVDPDNFKVTAKVTCSVRDFNGKIAAVVYDLDTNAAVDTVFSNMNVKSGATATVTVTGKLTKVQGGKMYYAKMNFLNVNGEWELMNTKKSGTIECNYVVFKTAGSTAISGVAGAGSNAPWLVYSIDGQFLSGGTGSPSAYIQSLPRGLYVVKMNGTVKKVRN